VNDPELHLAQSVKKLRIELGFPESRADSAEHALTLSDDLEIKGVSRGPLIALGLVLLGALLIVAVQYRPWSRAGQEALGNDVIIALHGTPPPVEPLILKQVPQDYARQVNSATPFTQLPVPSAAPFQFVGSATDMSRATDCLAATIYYEAGNEALAGQMAVAQVVLNRTRHPAYPHTICGVVFQGHERSTGCQFSYTCDGSIFRRQPSPQAWDSARVIARAMIGGTVYKPVGTATHYHTDWVIPYWSAKLDKVRAEQSHLFFRWTGFWGTPKAFRARYVGGEEAFPKLASLSPAHAVAMVDPAAGVLGQIDLSKELATDFGATTGNMTAFDGATLGSADLATMTIGGSPALDVPATAGQTVADPLKGQFLLRVNSTSSPSALQALAEQTCGTRAYCKVLGWTDANELPRGFPVSDSSLSSLSFSYLRDTSRGFEKALFNCRVYAGADPRQCMRGRGGPVIAKPSAIPPKAQATKTPISSPRIAAPNAIDPP
jgi:Cell Wall Hydrolase